MSAPTAEEIKLEIIQGETEKEEKKVGETSPFWKRYVDRENSAEKLRDESVSSEVVDARMERISPLELESSSLLDWTFEEQFKQVGNNYSLSHVPFYFSQRHSNHLLLLLTLRPKRPWD